MRRAAVFSGALLMVVALPAAASAQASIKCEYQGGATKVVVTNPDNADRQCSYLCKYSRQFGEYQVSGSTGVKAGESKTVHEQAGSTPITGVKELSATCK